MSCSWLQFLKDWSLRESRGGSPNLRYAIPYQGEEIWPEKQWQWSRERAFAAIRNNELVIKKIRRKWSVNYKQYLRGSNGEDRGSKLYSIIDKVYTQQGTNELKAMFGDGKTFDFPKPSDLVKVLVQAFSDVDSLILDSFGGSGTTAHAVLKANAEDGGHRRCILVEMDPAIARDITAERVRRVAQGYTNAKGEAVAGLGGGFCYARLGHALFTAAGHINPEVRFADLARFVWFMETGVPWVGSGNEATEITQRRHPRAGGDPVTSVVSQAKTLDSRLRGNDEQKLSPLLGVHEGRAIYLLYNGILKDKSVGGGNVLTSPLLAELPPHDGPKTIYGTRCPITPERRRALRIDFKQLPYQIKVAR